MEKFVNELECAQTAAYSIYNTKREQVGERMKEVIDEFVECHNLAHDLEHDLERFTKDINALIKQLYAIDLAENQFDAVYRRTLDYAEEL